MKVSRILIPIETVRRGFSLSLGAFETVLEDKGYRALLWMLLGTLLFWHIYVPVHEMLHVAGCLMAGGDISALNLKPRYGGVVLSKIFSFVAPSSDYAGRLTGFKVSNAWAYALVDFFPYSISLSGITLIRFCRKKRSAFFLSLGFILTFVPFMSIPGDTYEAVSLLTTKLAEGLDASLPGGVLVSDDVFRSIGTLSKENMLDVPMGVLISLGVLMAAYLAFMTLALQVWISNVFYGPFEKETGTQFRRKQ